jgi:hypothetical protein
VTYVPSFLSSRSTGVPVLGMHTSNIVLQVVLRCASRELIITYEGMAVVQCQVQYNLYTNTLVQVGHMFIFRDE